MSTEEEQVSDLALMTSYLDGDTASFEIFYKRHGDKLFNFIKKILYGNEADAKDVTQIVWSQWFDLCLSGEKTAEELSPAFLFTIGKNKCKDYLRSKYRRDDMLDKFSNESDVSGSSADDMEGTSTLNKDIPLITTVYTAIDRQLENIQNELDAVNNEFDRKRITNKLTKFQVLVKQQKQIFDFTWMGYSRKEISEMSGLTPDVVRSRGLQLRDLLSDFDIDL